MAWTDVPDFTVGQVLTSARINQMRNNDNIGHRVCTSATRPSSPDTGSMIYESDTSRTLVWNGSAWNYTSVLIVTSVTRPSSVPVGTSIYESDTGKVLFWNGTTWQLPWNQPWGIIGIGEHNTGAAVSANTSFCSVTFNPVLNRYYQAFYTSRTIWTTAGTIGIFDSVANGRIAEQYGAPDPVILQRTKTFSSTASRTLSIRTDGAQTPISGSYSGQERPAQLVVMDIGPAT